MSEKMAMNIHYGCSDCWNQEWGEGSVVKWLPMEVGARSECSYLLIMVRRITGDSSSTTVILRVSLVLNFLTLSATVF